ncbi:MAG: thrombospondin type 3 repeat-containing protein [Verrucomicrobia bacterium]|nr:thrombospondin type 3 repeat-containing protein [Verrucomicrobiota bacterium]MBU1857836.1 thrombospondin type 3 repeat-containing protein [Verrucomicrobiota bacterium]
MSTKFRLYFCVSAFCILHSTFLFAQGPSWWLTRGAVDPNLSPNDYAPITQGQLKWMAVNARDEMNAYFGAGSTIPALIATFSNSNNYYLANLGQVKYVAQPFYDRLYEFNLTNTFPANMPGYYPWGNSSSTNDFALANIGQVKYVFSFDSAVDSDGDGLSDWLEAKLGTDPYNSDTDGDGLSDWWEVANGGDPLDPDDAEPEVTNMRETARQRIIYHWQLYFGMTPTFTNSPGSAADLNDMKDALNALSGKFYKVE